MSARTIERSGHRAAIEADYESFERRPKRRGSDSGEPIIWPRYSVGRQVIVDQEGSSQWTKFDKTINARFARVGNVASITTAACVYLTPEDFSGILQKRYGRKAPELTEKARKDKARELACNINTLIARLRVSGTKVEKNEIYVESADIRERMADPDNPKWDERQRAAWMSELPANETQLGLWLPTRVRTTADPEGSGAYGIGIGLMDDTDLLARERSTILRGLRTELRAPTSHISPEGDFTLKLIDTTPTPVAGIGPIEFPRYPLAVSLAAPMARLI